MEASFFGNLDQRDYVAGGGHPRTGFYQAFLKLAKPVWILHRLAYSFDPAAKIFQVKKGSEFSDSYMESVLKNIVVDEKGESPRVGLMVMPGFWIGGSVVQSRVYVSGVKVVESRRRFSDCFCIKLQKQKGNNNTCVTVRSPGVRPGLSKGRYGHVSTHLDNPTCPITRKNGNGGVSNKLLSEVVLDQPARMTLYTTLCGN
ncbi:hypothetical protein YC2023_048881 [Brassica napus]